MDINSTLKERGSRYGTFEGQAEISQSLSSLISMYVGLRQTKLEADQREAIHMICHKLARIINGDPNYDDSWVDIAGYATLIADRLRGKIQ